MRRTLFLALLLTATAHAQWDLQNSGSTADLRGIHAVGKGIAWASGTNGTVLRTEDGGNHWQRCTAPPDAEKLDFRGIQAFDANTAIVMSSGKGDLSRLYKTIDGCQTWKLVFTNPDAEGFWDAIRIITIKGYYTDGSPLRVGVIVGDPVNGKIAQFRNLTNDGEHWKKDENSFLPDARENESLFAASNSALLVQPGGKIFVTGGKSGSRSRVLSEYVKHDPTVSRTFVGADLPFAASDSGGAFSIASTRLDSDPPSPKDEKCCRIYFVDMSAKYVVVGGDYKKPDNSKGTAASSSDGGLHWHASTTPPHGYRSAVAYDASTKTWITVGPNGTDISTDDGRNWRALKPGPSDAPDDDQHWNALSLPFVVGPHGRVGLLNPAALKSK